MPAEGSPDTSGTGSEPRPNSSSSGFKQHGGSADGHVVQETRGIEAVGKRVKGAQKLLGNFAGFIQETSKSIEKSLSVLGQPNHEGDIRRPRRGAERTGQHPSMVTSPLDNAAAKRLETARSDAGQYFVNYSCLDISLLPAELVHEPGGPMPGHARAATVVATVGGHHNVGHGGHHRGS